MPSWRPSLWPFSASFIRRSTKNLPSGSCTRVLSAPTQDWDSAQCLQSRMSRALSSGTRRRTLRMPNTGSTRRADSWLVSLSLLNSILEVYSTVEEIWIRNLKLKKPLNIKHYDRKENGTVWIDLSIIFQRWIQCHRNFNFLDGFSSGSLFTHFHWRFHFLNLEFSEKEGSVNCKTNSPNRGESCKVDLEAFSPCVARKGFEYISGRPCIFLKLNKIYNWEPEYYQKGDELPEKMPQSLKSHIAKRKTNEDMRVVWVSCEGESPADIENLGKDFEFKSLGGEQGFLGKYFPFQNNPGYLQPLVAVQFRSLKSKLR